MEHLGFGDTSIISGKKKIQYRLLVEVLYELVY
jgi:hypothetical protein